MTTKTTNNKQGASFFLKNIGCAGGAAVITVSFIHPIDVIKTRLQIQGEVGRVGGKQYNGVSGVIKTVLADEGAAAFYKGIGAAWMREASYTSLRIGLYEPAKSWTGADQKGAGFSQKFAAGAIAGTIGSTAGNPFDVLKTRMMANESASNNSVFQYIREIHAKEGMAGFYRGLQANVMRASVLNATKMGVYDQVKQNIKALGFKDGFSMQFTSAFVAGFFMTVTVAPFDIIRTRLMNQPVEADKKMYNGFIDCFSKILKTEGPMGFYKGFMPIWSRFAPTTCLQLVFFEAFRKLSGLSAI